MSYIPARRSAHEPELALDPAVPELDLPTTSIPYADVLDTLFDDQVSSGATPADAADALLDEWVFRTSEDSTARLWSLIVDADTDFVDAAAIDRTLELGRHFLVSYRTADVALWLLDRHRDALDVATARRAVWVATHDPHPLDRTDADEVDVDWDAYATLDDPTVDPLHELADEWDVPAPAGSLTVTVTDRDGNAEAHDVTEPAARWLAALLNSSDSDDDTEGLVVALDEHLTDVAVRADTPMPGPVRTLLTGLVDGLPDTGVSDGTGVPDDADLTIADPDLAQRWFASMLAAHVGPAHRGTDDTRSDEQRDNDRVWAEQIGAAYTTDQVAQLTGRTVEQVTADTGLLALEQASGTVAYPTFQFDMPDDVRATLVRAAARVVATPWTTASWLTSSHPDLDGHTPADAAHDRPDDVIRTAARWARRLNDGRPVTETVHVDVPASWIGLTVFGTFDDDGTGQLVDLLGRNVTRADAPEAASPAPSHDDVRTVPTEAAGLTVTVQLTSDRSGYTATVTVTSAEGYVLADAAPLPAPGFAGDVALADGSTLQLRPRLAWPSGNVRQIAIGTVKRSFSVTKPVAARTVDEARFDLADAAPDTLAETVGSVAVGHLSAGTVGPLLANASDGQLAGYWEDPRLLAVVADHEIVATVDAANWAHVQVGEHAVRTGLPAHGGPNPRTAAKRLTATVAQHLRGH